MSVATQLKNITDKLQGYFSALSLNLTSTANALPSFEDYVSLLDYDEIYTQAVDGAERAANYATGALSDTVHQVIAINREFDIRSKTKSQYFSDGIVDSATDAANYQDMYGRYTNYYRGTAPEQMRD
jgi:hypothetical protein